GRFARDDPAIDLGDGRLRQRVRGMTALQYGGNAGCAELRIVLRTDREPGESHRIRLVREHRADVRRILLVLELRGARKPGARGIVEVQRKLELREPHQAFGQTIDRVVLAGYRRVPAGVLDLQLKGHRYFLTGLDVDAESLAIPQIDGAALV